MKPMTDFTQLKIITKSRGAAKEVGSLVKQQGAALVVALIMLVLMTLVGITAMQVTTVQEKMVANSRDLNVAFQAAEVALLRGEHYVKNMQDAIFTTTCKGSGSTIGLCKPGQSTPIWTTISWSDTNPVTLEYGNEQENKQIPASETSFDNIQPLPANTVAKQPRYIIEDITSVSGGGQANLSKGLYRITAQGYGQAVNDNGQPLARVMLQSVFKK